MSASDWAYFDMRPVSQTVASNSSYTVPVGKYAFVQIGGRNSGLPKISVGGSGFNTASVNSHCWAGEGTTFTYVSGETGIVGYEFNG